MNQENQPPTDSAAKGCLSMTIVMIISMAIAVGAAIAAQKLLGF